MDSLSQVVCSSNRVIGTVWCCSSLNRISVWISKSCVDANSQAFQRSDGDPIFQLSVEHDVQCYSFRIIDENEGEAVIAYIVAYSEGFVTFWEIAIVRDDSGFVEVDVISEHQYSCPLGCQKLAFSSTGANIAVYDGIKATILTDRLTKVAVFTLDNVLRSAYDSDVVHLEFVGFRTANDSLVLFFENGLLSAFDIPTCSCLFTIELPSPVRPGQCYGGSQLEWSAMYKAILNLDSSRISTTWATIAADGILRLHEIFCDDSSGAAYKEEKSCEVGCRNWSQRCRVELDLGKQCRALIPFIAPHATKATSSAGNAFASRPLALRAYSWTKHGRGESKILVVVTISAVILVTLEPIAVVRCIFFDKVDRALPLTAISADLCLGVKKTGSSTFSGSVSRHCHTQSPGLPRQGLRGKIQGKGDGKFEGKAPDLDPDVGRLGFDSEDCAEAHGSVVSLEVDVFFIATATRELYHAVIELNTRTENSKQRSTETDYADSNISSQHCAPLTLLCSSRVVEATASSSSSSKTASPLSIRMDSSSRGSNHSVAKGAAASSGSSSSSMSTKVVRSRGSWEQPVIDKATKRIVDQPVVFNNKIKSSGYGQTPNSALDRMARARQLKLAASSSTRRNFITNNMGVGILAESLHQRHSHSAPTTNTGIDGAGNTLPHYTSYPDSRTTGQRIRLYPMDCGPMTEHQPQNDILSSSSPALRRVVFSRDASTLALVSVDGTLRTVNLPVARHGGEGYRYMGHNGALNNASFSLSRKLIVSSSADGTARVWNIGQTEEAAVMITHTRSDCAPSTTAVSAVNVKASADYRGALGRESAARSSTNVNNYNKNKAFSGEVSWAQFYYMDQFVAMACASSVYMFAYSLDHDDASAPSLTRRLTYGRYKRAHVWNVEAKCVTALSCVNSAYSPLLFCATSNRKLHILDAQSGSVSRVLESPHERAIHSIALPEPSIHAPPPPRSLGVDGGVMGGGGGADSYNLFATAATDNVVALWDLRSPTVTARYTNHVNRREAVQCALSPCLRYVAVGSEDCSASVVEVRSGRELVRLTGQHKDVVSAVAFNPLFAQLVSASYDGTVKFYADHSSSG